MQKVIPREIKIISDWQMYKECGVSMTFVEDVCYGTYFPYSVKDAHCDSLAYAICAAQDDDKEYTQKSKWCRKIADYLIALGFNGDEKVFISID